MRIISQWGCVFITLLSIPLMASEVVRKAPVLIEASEVLIDEPKGVSTYSGEVLFQQGSMSLRADQVSVFSDQRSLNRIEASGEPVLFEVKSEDGKSTRAEARSMSYQMSDGRLLMEGEAQLWQEGNYFSGGRIEFDIYEDRVLASQQGDGKKRVRVVIQPSEFDQNNHPVKEEASSE